MRAVPTFLKLYNLTDVVITLQNESSSNWYLEREIKKLVVITLQNESSSNEMLASVEARIVVITLQNESSSNLNAKK